MLSLINPRFQHKNEKPNLNISKFSFLHYKFMHANDTPHRELNHEYNQIVGDNINVFNVDRNEQIRQIRNRYNSNNYVWFPTHFDDTYLMPNVKMVYHKLKNRAWYNERIRLSWGMNTEDWQKNLRIRKEKMKFLLPAAKRHGQQLLFRRLEPSFYTCKFCGDQSNRYSHDDKFIHNFQCTEFRRIWKLCVTNLNLNISQNAHILEICFGFNIENTNIQNIPSKCFNIVHKYIELHWCIWKFKDKLEDEKIFFESVHEQWKMIHTT